MWDMQRQISRMPIGTSKYLIEEMTMQSMPSLCVRSGHIEEDLVPEIVQ